MKVCENCGTNIDAKKDGDNLCEACELADSRRELLAQRRKNRRQMHDQTLRDVGLVKVRGNLGGTYWE